MNFGEWTEKRKETAAAEKTFQIAERSFTMRQKEVIMKNRDENCRKRGAGMEEKDFLLRSRG